MVARVDPPHVSEHLKPGSLGLHMQLPASPLLFDWLAEISCIHRLLQWSGVRTGLVKIDNFLDPKFP